MTSALSEDFIPRIGFGKGCPGVPKSEEHRRNLSSVHMGKIVSEETRKKLSEATKGRTLSEEHRRRISESLTGKVQSEEHGRRNSESHMGHIHSEETKRKISEGNMGKPGGMLGKTHSEETRGNMSESHKRYWANLSKEKRDKRTKNLGGTKSPTMNELTLDSYLQSRFPGEWLYNGNGDTRIGGRKPDFININGKKEVIETMGIYYHPESDEQERIAHYAKYGFRCIVVWEWDCYLPEELDKIFGMRIGS